MAPSRESIPPRPNAAEFASRKVAAASEESREISRSISYEELSSLRKADASRGRREGAQGRLRDFRQTCSIEGGWANSGMAKRVVRFLDL
jgi:hypothetical protein